MPFQRDLVLDEEAEKFFGEYMETFHSEKGQVIAHLFRKDDWLIAHVQMPTGLRVHEITDPYLTDLQTFAADRGFGDKLRIIYAE